MSRATAIALTVASAAAINNHPRGYYEEKFFNWVQEHNIKIGNGQLFTHFLQNFANNDDIIELHNSQNLSYQLGHNQFSHMDVNEWREAMKLGLGYPAAQPADAVHDAAEGYTASSSVDWRTKGAVTGVKDQGQCGSCWSFSTTGALEGMYQIHYGSLVSMSEQHFVDCDDNGDHGCNGGWMDNAFEWAKSNGGVCAEDAYPYTAAKGTCHNSSCGTKHGKPSGYTDVTPNSVNALLSALDKQPVSVAIEADQSTFQLYKSGVLTAACGSNLDHGVLAVGYGTDNGVNYWIVKNSWGTKWGEGGYIRLSRDVSAKAGQCGILSAASYPHA
jgi:C1A family cysteine protease